MLFVPGDRGDRFEKATLCGADVVVCDLEDAVAPDRKDSARRTVVNWLRGGGAACVRINAVDQPGHADDRAALRGLPGLQAVVVPKADDPALLERIADELDGEVPVLAIIETALGVHLAYEVARARGVVRLVFGSIDFALDTAMEEHEHSLLFARSTLVVASRAAGIASPVDGVSVNLEDPVETTTDARHANRIGFGGKLCIHPNQVANVNQAFSPTEEEVAWARRVIAGVSDEGVTRLEGRMVDKPLVVRARSVLQRVHLSDLGSGATDQPGTGGER